MRPLLGLTTAIFLLLPLLATAQEPVPRYRSPYGPTLSPYLDYFRRDVGVLDRYNAFVSPQIQQRQRFRRIEQGVDAYQRDVRQMREEIAEIREPDAPATGTASDFMNFSHYYRVPAAGGRSQPTRR